MPDNDVAHISGNAAAELKRGISNPLLFIGKTSTAGKALCFGELIATRLIVTEVSIEKKAEEPQKQEARVVCEVTVAEGGSVLVLVTLDKC
jgi:acyl-coenzyme A thioesterase 13